jgi:hypothetical protein
MEFKYIFDKLMPMLMPWLCPGAAAVPGGSKTHLTRLEPQYNKTKPYQGLENMSDVFQALVLVVSE